MDNCLVTKLKGYVSDTTLPKLGALRLNISVNANTTFTITFPAGLPARTITSLTGKTFVVNGNTVSEVTLSTAAAFTLQSGDYVFEIGDKYTITRLSLAQAQTLNLSKNDLSVFAFMEDLEWILLVASDGDIATLAPLTELKQIQLPYRPGITGDIAALGTLTQATMLNFYNSGVTGAIEDFVAAQVANGKSSNTTGINMFSVLAYLTFGGSGVSTLRDYILTWESASKIILYGGATTIANSTYVYAKGASAAEISAWEAAGKTVVVIS